MNLFSPLKLGRFYGAYWRSNFARALSFMPTDAKSVSAAETYARYRLGLYATVARQPSAKSLEAALASAVSFAACGRLKEALPFVQPVKASGNGRLQCHLADAIAPYAPAVAMELLPATASFALRLAILLRLNQFDEARQLLDTVDLDVESRSDPQLLLLASNTIRPGASEQLRFLNGFLNHYGLSSVMLLNPLQPPGCRNLQGESLAPSVQGPLVSIVMTAFNSAERIGAALQSLLVQTYQNIEIIVVDDDSGDETGVVVRDMASRDARIRYLRLPVNVGTYVAKTVGAGMARGEFLTCQDSDDWAHPLKIERQVKPLLSDPALVYTVSQWVRLQDDGVYYARPVHPLMRMNPASPLFRKSIVEKQAGLWDAVRTGADSEFSARLKLVFGRRAMKRIVEPLTLGAHRDDSLMTSAETGYCAQGMSPVRLAYWESWNAWHIDCLRKGKKPVLGPIKSTDRVFHAPDSILVDRERVNKLFKLL